MFFRFERTGLLHSGLFITLTPACQPEAPEGFKAAAAHLLSRWYHGKLFYRSIQMSGYRTA